MSTTETRRFKTHPRLLYDVITRQAGTLAKAIVELVMNSIDAGARSVTVEVSDTAVTVSDDGKGMTDRAAIETYFECFGQPHDAKENKVYGTFRMGRGQAFAFGVNRWRTGPFEMTVDIKERGTKYDLVSTADPVAGCSVRIALYEPVGAVGAFDTISTVEKWVKYAPIPVTVNGRRVTTDPADEKWDHVTDDAYVRLTNMGSLAVYNLGVHTLDMGSYRLGTGGVVVSRKQLRVNMARNDIQSDCPVWRRVRDLVDVTAANRIKRRSVLSDAQVQRVVNTLLAGTHQPGAADMLLFRSSSGRSYSARELVQTVEKYQYTVTFCASGDRRGDRVHEARLAFVLDRACLDLFRCHTDPLLVVRTALDALGAPSGHVVRRKAKYVAFDDLKSGMSDNFDVVPVAEHSVTQKAWLDLSARAWTELHDDRTGRPPHGRRFLLGRSDVADGWTDGRTYIAIADHFLKKLTFDVGGFTKLGVLLLHELTHDEDDATTHVHSPEFYRTFHDSAFRSLGQFVAGCAARVTNVVKSLGKGATRKVLADRDRARALLDQVDKLRALVAPAAGEQK